MKESQTSIQRYIRLTYLIEELLKLIDETFIERHRLITLGIRSGVELSYLTIEEQKLVYEMMLYDEMTPDLSQCKRIRELSKMKKLDGYALEEIFHELKGCQQNRIYFNKSKIIS